MTKDDLSVKGKWINDIRRNFDLSEPAKNRFPLKLYHYTSLPVLFSLLENDSIWASGTRFSNDSSEETLLKNEVFQDLNYVGDSFIICFSDKEDCLSQWRGYCFHGGVSIEFDVTQPRNYSVLHADNDVSHKYELIHNVPFPVLYVEQEQLSSSPNSLTRQLLEESDLQHYAPWKARDIIPYFKDRAFEEESEWRLMFGNHNGELSKCVRFRTVQDGIKVPYMVVKSGDLGEDLSQCQFDPNEYTKDKMDLMRESGKSIMIPQGNDQESIYYKMESIVAEYNNKRRKDNWPMKIYCEGHLPIRRIIVSPTYARERVAEKIKRYCWSIYWLRNVDVLSSNIPYIPPSE